MTTEVAAIAYAVGAPGIWGYVPYTYINRDERNAIISI